MCLYPLLHHCKVLKGICKLRIRWVWIHGRGTLWRSRRDSLILQYTLLLLVSPSLTEIVLNHFNWRISRLRFKHTLQISSSLNMNFLATSIRSQVRASLSWDFNTPKNYKLYLVRSFFLLFSISCKMFKFTLIESPFH